MRRLFSSGYRDGGGWVQALDRRRAADRLLESWRRNLHAQAGLTATDGRHIVDLSGLSVGDLPALGRYFGHVRVLNLSEVKLTEEGSNAFLRGFMSTTPSKTLPRARRVPACFVWPEA